MRNRFRHPLRDLKRWLEGNALQDWGTRVYLPIMAFYNTERAVSHLAKQRARPKSATSRYAALAGALSARTSFRELFEWFYMKENEELREQRERRDHDYRLKELSVVRKAISSMIEGITEPHVKLRPLRFVVPERLDDRKHPRTDADDAVPGAEPAPCLVSAAVLASLLPADADRGSFLHVLGIHGDPVEAKKRIAIADRIGNPNTKGVFSILQPARTTTLSERGDVATALIYGTPAIPTKVRKNIDTTLQKGFRSLWINQP